MKKMIAAALVFFLLAGLSAGVFAVAPGTVSFQVGGGGLGDAYDEDSVPISGSVYQNGTLEGIAPGQTIYLKLSQAVLQTAQGGSSATVSDSNLLADEDVFRFKAKKSGDGKSLLEKIVPVSGKKDADGNRCGWIKIVIAQDSLTEEEKAELFMTFTAREDDATGGWSEGDSATVNLDLWISPPEQSGDSYDADPGEQFIYHPVSNEKNEVDWDGVATLSFTADDDASKFYAKLSTKADSAVSNRYPNAELYFRDFTGAPDLSTSSRAVLTLLNPWTEDDRAPVNPESCRIYTKDTDGELTDVTSLFTYLVTDEEGNEVDGWRIKTRMLGSYVISDVPLTLSDASGPLSQAVGADPVESAADSSYKGINNNTKPNPPTGR